MRFAVEDRSPRESRDSLADRIIQRAQSAVAGVHDELRRELKRRLEIKQRANAPLAELVEEARKVIEKFKQPLVRILTDARLAAFLNGARRAAAQLPEIVPPVPGAPLPAGSPFIIPGIVDEWKWPGMKIWLPLVEGAARDLQERQLFRKADFDALEAGARSRAFTIANVNSAESLSQIREALVESVTEGKTLTEFKEAVDESLGTSTLGPGHLENVFRTNMSSSYSHGLDEVLDHPLVVDEFPYEETLPIRDSRLTELCEVVSESGIGGSAIYRRDDPVWRKFKPPRHWQCRCGRRPLSVSDAAQRGIREAQEWLRTGETPVLPAFVRHPRVDLPPGWVPGGR